MRWHRRTYALFEAASAEKEERILYPEADRALPVPTVARLTAFLELDRLPDGWVCVKARA